VPKVFVAKFNSMPFSELYLSLTMTPALLTKTFN